MKADKKVRKYAEGGRTAADIAGRRSARPTPKVITTPKAMPTPKTTTLVRPKPKPSPKPVPQVQPRPVTVTPKATVVTPKATVVTPKPKPNPNPSPNPEPVDETDYFRGQIRRNLRNNPLPKIGNDLVKFKKGGKIRGYGIARGGKPCKMR